MENHKQSNKEDKILELEKRIKELEQRPIYYPVYQPYNVPNYIPNYHPYYSPYFGDPVVATWCGSGCTGTKV